MPHETLYPPPVDLCDLCGDDADSLRQTSDGEHVCSLCIHDRYSTCEWCDMPALDDTSHRSNNGTVCNECRVLRYWVCAVWNCDVVITSGDYCDNCEPDECDDYCEGCEECDSGHGSLINSYSYKPVPEFFGTGPVFLGFELEIDVPCEEIAWCAHTAVNHLSGLGYLKEDGSIGHGFEIVTHPMSHDYAIAEFPWEMLEALRAQGCTAGRNGLHVHVSRKGFDSSTHVYRWLKLLHRNAQHVQAVARRNSEEWAPWRSHDRRNAKNHAKGGRDAGRYAAINVTNYATFEVRVFASTLDRQELQASLDLVAASVEYTRNLSVAVINNGGWTWSSFTDWVAEKQEYAALTRMLGDVSSVSSPGALACAC